MICTLTYTRTPWHVRALRPLMVWYLRNWITDELFYIELLRDGGIHTDAELAIREANLAPVHMRLALWMSR